MSSRVNCCVPGCNSVYKKNPELTFHHFPKSGQRVEHVSVCGVLSRVERKKMWEIRLKIGKRVTSNMRVCSKHFSDEDFITPGDWGYKKRYLKKTAIPSKNLPVSTIIIKSKNEDRSRRLERLMKRREINKFPNCASNIEKKENIFDDSEAAEALLSLSDTQFHQRPFKENTFNEFSTPLKKFVDAATQTDDQKELKHAEVQVNTYWPHITECIKTEQALNILTGISTFNLLFLLVHWLTAYSKHFRCKTLSVKERILLVFFKFKLDLTYSSLGVLFGGISVPTCKRIFQETVEILSNILTNFVFLPSKENVLQNIPICFKNYQKVRIVLDCTEIKVQVPKKLCCRIKLYSHYKKNHTLKFMTAVTPSGFIAHVSPCYGGRASDKSIFEQSGIIEQLIPYVDEIMVDKGFLIDNICMEHGIKLVRPPFLKKKKQLSKNEASENRNIASARVHIERVNARIKVFKIFKNTFPLHLVPFVDYVFSIICAIVNLSSPILKDKRFLQ